MIELRPGGTADLAEVDRVMRAAFDPRYGEAWTSSQCAGVLALPGVWLTLAEIDGGCVGFALTRLVADESELLLLAVEPRHRRRGIASALLRSVIDQARTRGALLLHLEVRAGNDAMTLYTSNGFEKVGERPGYYRGSAGKLLDAYTLQKRIG